MPKKPKVSPLARLAYFLGGFATLILVGSLLWAGFTSPLNSRMPVPSPDGRYFAYFNPGSSGETKASDLIIARPQGKMLARFQIPEGRVIWSNANHLVVVGSPGRQAILVANAEDRFVLINRISLSPGGDPQWAPDGNKLACVQQLVSGPQLAIFDIQQSQTFAIPMPADFRLNHARLIAWSPGGEQVYFLNSAGSAGNEAAFLAVDVHTGALRELARGKSSSQSRLPQLSPDGARLYWGPPENVVVSARTGEKIWTLPSGAQGLWMPWSRDGLEFYFQRQDSPSIVFAHNFESSSDRSLISGVSGHGVFDSDGESYFYRETPLPRNSPESGPGKSGMKTPGWRLSDRGSSSRALAGIEIWPWERTLDGLILARRDDSTRVRYGLFDPETHRLEPYKFPTDGEDFLRQVKSYRLVIATVALFAILAVVVLVKRPETKSGRAFPLLLFLSIALGCGSVFGDSVSNLSRALPYRITIEEIDSLGWGISSSLPQLVFAQSQETVAWLWALLPIALLNFCFAFPDRNHFLKSQVAIERVLYGIACLPALVTAVSALRLPMPSTAIHYVAIIAIILTAIVWALALGSAHQRPPDKASRHAVRWFVAALGILAGGYVSLAAVRRGMVGLPDGFGRQSLVVLEASFFLLAAWVAPSAMTYAVVARKPLALGKSLSNLFRQIMMGMPTLLVFGLTWAAASLVITGALWAPSPLPIIIAVFLTVIAVLPFRGRLRVAIDKRFDRTRFEAHERLAAFARNLPHIVDHEALARQLEDEVVRSLQARWCLLYIHDRATGKMIFQRGKTALSSDARQVTFNPAEPLCEYLRNQDPVFEPLLAPSDDAMMEVMASGGERLQKLQAEVVLGLVRTDLLGMIVVGPKANRDLYDEGELNSLRVIARETAAALENIELFSMAARDREMRKELDDASDIQAKLLPGRVPNLTSGQLAGCCYPARSTGADYYDFIELPGRKVGLVMSDVAGKGMPAALLTASVEKILGSQIPATPSLAILVQKLNGELIAGSPIRNMATFFFGVFDDATRRLEYVNAGHPPPLLVTPGGSMLLDSTGLPLGLFKDLTHVPRAIDLPKGSMLLIHSDGVEAARNVGGEFFGKERLASALSRNCETPADRALAQIVAEIREFEGDVLLDDDQTFILLKVHSE